MIKVLIIDDDAATTDVLEAMLGRADFEVEIANSGPEGLDITRRLDPDIIILDLMMPGMSGWEVCRQIRTFSQTPILIFSASTGTEDVMQAMDAGANDYLVKPVPKGVLVSRLKRLI